MAGVEAALVSVRSGIPRRIITGTINLGVGVLSNTAVITAVDFVHSYALPIGNISNDPTVTLGDLGIVVALTDAVTVTATRSQSLHAVTAGFLVVGY